MHGVDSADAADHFSLRGILWPRMRGLALARTMTATNATNLSEAKEVTRHRSGTHLPQRHVALEPQLCPRTQQETAGSTRSALWAAAHAGSGNKLVDWMAELLQ